MSLNFQVGKKYTLQFTNHSTVTGIFIGFQGSFLEFDFGIVERFNVTGFWETLDSKKSSLELFLDNI